MRLLIWIIMFLFTLNMAFSLELSEILFNPDGADDKKEFIELRGEDNLEDCTVSDSKSSDVLELIQEGGELILIVETDSYLNETPGATIYGAGKAIGNGLGNSGDDIIIRCDEVLLNTSYNIDDIANYTAGYSIVFNESWILGTHNGTPGDINYSEIITILVEEEGCNNSLVITMGKTKGHPGDVVHFSVISNGYASWEAYADREVFAYGDTFTMKTHSISLPETEVKLVARTEECDARQRATRIIKIIPKNDTVINESVSEIIAAIEEPEAEEPIIIPEPIEVTKEIIYDRDANVVPWVSIFGSVTLLVSAWLFKHEKSI